MAIYQARGTSRYLAGTSAVLGFLGLALCWWLPLGAVLSLAGSMVGLVGWFRSSTDVTGRGWAAGAVLFCLAVLALDLVLGASGYVLLTFDALR
jgi:hypothetical protein